MIDNSFENWFNNQYHLPKPSPHPGWKDPSVRENLKAAWFLLRGAQVPEAQIYEIFNTISASIWRQYL